MEIYQVLKEDHRNLLHLLDRLESSEALSGEHRVILLKDLREELVSHAKAEEEAFLKHLKSVDNCGVLAQEASRELEWITQLLTKIESLDPSNSEWESQFRTLRERIESHIDEDEKRMFPEAKRILSSEESAQMAEDFDEMKDQALNQTRPQ